MSVKFTVLGNTHRLATAPLSESEAKCKIIQIYPQLRQHRLSLVYEGKQLEFPITKQIKFEVLVHKQPQIFDQGIIQIGQLQQQRQPIRKKYIHDLKQLKVTCISAENKIYTKIGHQYQWKVTLSNTGKVTWPPGTRLYLLDSQLSWPLAELNPNEHISKILSLKAAAYKLIQMRAGIDGTMFGAKICHQILQKQSSDFINSGISCSQSTWRKQRR